MPADPMLQDVMLDEATLDRLFTDVAELATLLDVAVKGAPEDMTPPSTPRSLADVRAALREGRVFGVQLRYRYAGTEWWDTLMRTASGVRLVRIDHGAALLAAAPSCDS